MTHDEAVDMKDFNEWWDSDIIRSSPFRKGSPAYWAWAGWQAALREHAISEVQRLGQEIEATQPVAWIWEKEDGYTSIETHSLSDEDMKNVGVKSMKPLYSTPPQRTWVGLTDEEMQSIAFESADALSAVFVAEAKLRSKNNG